MLMEAKTRKMYDLNKCEMEKIREMPMGMRETRYAMRAHDGGRCMMARAEAMRRAK